MAATLAEIEVRSLVSSAQTRVLPGELCEMTSEYDWAQLFGWEILEMAQEADA